MTIELDLARGVCVGLTEVQLRSVFEDDDIIMHCFYL